MQVKTYYDRLAQDMPFLTSDGRLNELVMDKIVLYLNRMYPQTLANNEALKFRQLNTPLEIRVPSMLNYLQKKGDKACREFYRALQSNAEHIYTSLPSRSTNNTSTSTGTTSDTIHKERYVLNNRSPVFFLACFSIAAGLACMLYCNNTDATALGEAKKVVGFSVLGIGRRAKNILLSYVENNSMKS
nr:PREDICTED: bcl10-interacting CARD protein isoform X2 [Latimeria chalumnae]|eukprot:XP_005993065.1 PREDICTED: bcl10-interacting CARD protein isoform X2 [Latimeria chalumnae]